MSKRPRETANETAHVGRRESIVSPRARTIRAQEQNVQAVRISIDPGDSTVDDIREFLRALSEVNEAAGAGPLFFELDNNEKNRKR